MTLKECDGGFALYKEKDKIGQCLLHPTTDGALLKELFILPQWRRRGYGSYLLKEVLHRYGGYSREAASCFTAPLPPSSEELSFWKKFDFVPEGEFLCRRKKPDFTAVQLCHDFLTAHLHAPGLCVDATCGNGGDTAFLCRLVGQTGHVLALDIQEQAILSTQTYLEREGIPNSRYTLVCADHARLMQYLSPESADAVLFNFGWLPRAEHTVFSTADSSIPALESALSCLKKGGILSAVLYSGRTIGNSEKQAVLRWLETLPLTRYTVLICRFGNWADTAPLPCFVLKK